MLDVEEKYLLKASAISTPEEICGPPYVTLAGIEFDLVGKVTKRQGHPTAIFGKISVRKTI